MTFDEILDHVIKLLRRQGRVSYRALRRRFDLDEEYIEDLKAELIDAQRLAVDEEGRVLVWTGEAGKTSEPAQLYDTQEEQTPHVISPSAGPRTPEAERRQLTVMFCDLADSTQLSSQLDPEDLREVMRAYQQTSAGVIQRFEGYIAQYLGDGLLVYFGFPQAHEDDAQRAVRAGLGILEAIETLNPRVEREQGIRLAVRVGIHTGPVVVGEMGGGGRHEQLALGETPNIAARLEGLATPNRVVISERTRRLVGGVFDLEDLGVHALKGLSMPMHVYGVQRESTTESRFEAATVTGLTPLVGRDEEIRLLLRRWEQAKEGEGQVVLLAGEAAIGKSRITQTLREHLADEPHIRLRCQCLPYYTNSAFYPIIAHLERAMLCARDAPPTVKLDALEALLVQAGIAVEDVAPLFAALLSIPSDDRYPPLTLSPQRRKDKTIEAVIDQVRGLSQQHPVLYIFEDVHWIDPTSLEVVDGMIDRIQDVRVLLVLTYRPEFTPRWSGFTHVTTHTLNRLSRQQVATMVGQVTGGKALPQEVRDQIVTKTDGVPLFVEELTKTVLESGLLTDDGARYRLTGPLPPLAIPDTLHGSLMARLDRLAPVRETAQIGAAIGREFSYELLAAVSPLSDAELHEALRQLVQTELVFRRGQPPAAIYMFKHALVQDAAYSSLLKSTRQQLHTKIATVMEAHFPTITEAEPELLAHHYTEAGLHAQAVQYWQRAGERAMQHSATVEAIAHLTKGLEVLTTLPDTPERTRQELSLQTALGPALMVTRGVAAPEVEQTYLRIQALAHHMEETPRGLWLFYYMRGEIETAHEFGAQLMEFAQRRQDPTLLFEAHLVLGFTLFRLGEVLPARTHFEQGMVLYDPGQHHAQAFLYAADPGVMLLCYTARDLWLLGYPAQALERSQAALTLASELAHPFSLAYALTWTAFLQQLRRDQHAVQARAADVIRLSTKQGFPFLVEAGTFLQGWALTAQEQWDVGMAQMSHALAGPRAAGVDQGLPYWLALLAEAYSKSAQIEEGLALLSEALAVARKAGGRYWEAELYRLKGVLLLHQRPPDATQAEAWLSQALAIARHQQVKAWELRAAMTLSRLWQRQGKQDAARQLLAEIYDWFTEGFETADLQEAQALLEELGNR